MDTAPPPQSARQAIRDALEQLPPRSRHAFLLIESDGLTPAEAAGVLKITPHRAATTHATVRRHLLGIARRHHATPPPTDP